jgi:uncharacterized membrane protein
VFDTVGGLPLHPLTVHAVVVLLPIACLLTVVVAVVPRWRSRAWWVVVLDAVVAVAAIVAKQTGERLLARVQSLSPTLPDGLATHTEWGGRLVLLAVLLVIAALAVAVTQWRESLRRVAVVAAVLVAVATLGLTVVVGDTGARAVWSSLIQNTKG